MKTPSLDDLRVFLAVACQGSLNAAANHLSASPATLSRRINQLEEQTGRSLFHRSATGYELTAEGESLRERVLILDAVRNELEEWLKEPISRTSIKISAGTWTTQFLVEHIHKLQMPDDDFGLVFLPTEQHLNIAHREIDIGLRNAQPDDPNLVARRLSHVRYATYASNSLALDENKAEEWPWVVITPECSKTLSARWMIERYMPQAIVQCTSSQTLLDLVIAGSGVSVLPCFVGDRLEGLKRVGPVIDELNGTQWLVMHGETRHRPAVRTTLDRISELVENNINLFEGDKDSEYV